MANRMAAAVSSSWRAVPSMDADGSGRYDIPAVRSCASWAALAIHTTSMLSYRRCSGEQAVDQQLELTFELAAGRLLVIRAGDVHRALGEGALQQVREDLGGRGRHLTGRDGRPYPLVDQGRAVPALDVAHLRPAEHARCVDQG